MTIYEKARIYIKYCILNDYTLKILCDGSVYVVITAGGSDYFDSWESMSDWLAQRYDDEKEAGNI